MLEKIITFVLLCSSKMFLFSEGSAEKIGIGFVIISQSDKYHYDLMKEKENDIHTQAKHLNLDNIKIFKSHEDFSNIIGHWTIFPLFEKLLEWNHEWIFFLEDVTNISLEQLIRTLSRYNSSQETFAGHALEDLEPTIIHHFASSEDDTKLLYPHFSSGFIISHSLMKRMTMTLPVDDSYSFTIDPKYEIAKFIWNNGLGIKFTHDPNFCLTKLEHCASWIDEEFPNCGAEISSDKIFVAVKTCHKFHEDRVKVVKNTWAPEVKNLNFFSDEKDSSIPTFCLGIENVPSGHCEKTFSILKFYLKKVINFEWLVIADDDTLFNFQRLKKLLACYDPSTDSVIGERYGYSIINNLGYDYITGGGGIILSLPAIKTIVENCSCPYIDSPDDMIIGMCLKKLNIPVIHSRHFHQARPIDYSPDFLKPFKHVSFHKHWMIDPYDVYKTWLKNPVEFQHSEL